MRRPLIRQGWVTHLACVGLGAILAFAVSAGLRISEEAKLRNGIGRSWVVEVPPGDTHTVASVIDYRPDGTFRVAGTTTKGEDLRQSGHWRVSGNTLLLDADETTWGDLWHPDHKPQQLTVARVDAETLILVEASGRVLRHRNNAPNVGGER